MSLYKCATCGKYHHSGECEMTELDEERSKKYVEIRMKFTGGHGLTHFCDKQEAVMKAIEMSDAGETGAEIFKIAARGLWDAIEKNEDFILDIPGLAVTYEEEF